MADIGPVPATEEKDQSKVNLGIQQLFKFINGSISTFSKTLLALTTAPAWRAALAIVSTHSVRGLTAINNASTPDTKMDVVFTECVLRNSAGDFVWITGGSFTVDCGAAGSALNSRDQSGVFSAGQFLHFYAIYGSGQTSGGLVSTVAPTTVEGPTLPTNYTHWAYLFTARWDGSSHLLKTYVRGSWVSINSGGVLSNGAATSETAVACGSFVPANALNIRLGVTYLGGTSTAGGRIQDTAHVRVVSGTDYLTWALDVTGAVLTQMLFPLGDTVIPNVSQQFYYHHSPSADSPLLTVVVTGYQVQNGE